MKKFKYLALVTALAVMLMGAGYAAWTDGFKVSNTINTGELSVAILAGDCNKPDEAYTVQFSEGYNGYNHPYRDLRANDNVYRVNDEGNKAEHNKRYYPTVENNTVSFGFGNLYPGTTVETNLSARNTGSVPVVLQSIKLDNKVGFDTELAEIIQVEYGFGKYDSGEKAPRVDLMTVSLAQLEESLQEYMTGIVLLPNNQFGSATGENLYTEMKFIIPGDWDVEGLDNNAGQNQEIKFDIEFEFIQYNLFER
ncbi:hypothetical protein [Desulfofalx alkaliphila]|uniref:hypothetical protein n=1 Tax=Desulfofalx alkaliphila TaxID=105483 RepID=UPI0004E21540|nr:hypothetical protein [Desulfofalx alkaliphila]